MMSPLEEKSCGFQDWALKRSYSKELMLTERFRSDGSMVKTNKWYIKMGFKSINKLSQLLFSKENIHVDNSWSRKILDPQGPFLQRWNKIFVLACVLAISVDPLFFYIPVVFDSGDHRCLDLDKNLEIAACILRSFTDMFYVLHIIFQFRTGFIAPSSRVLGKGLLVKDPAVIAKRYLSSYFPIDILAVLPLPQVIILCALPELEGDLAPLYVKNLLRFTILLQYAPRLFRIFPLYKEVTRSSGIIIETAWAGAAFNLFLYMLASHVFGAFWYLLAIEREDTCWRDACNSLKSCNVSHLYCSIGGHAENSNFLDTFCPINEANATIFDFGIYLSALQNVVTSRNFFEKLFYCFWWGMQNLTSLGQSLQTSTFVGEILFAMLVSIAGLVLCAFLIGNMKTYLQSSSTRIEEMRVEWRDAEQWMAHRLLPENLRERIRRHEQYKWQETRGADEGHLLLNLPKDQRREIKHHLCLALLRRVPMFEKMDDRLIDALIDRLKPVLYTEGISIVREGDPVKEMLFIMRGRLESMTTNGGRANFFNSEVLKAGDFCGDELLTWALDPQTSTNLPVSTRAVKSLTEVEAFALVADDLKFVASQFRKLHSKQLRHTFRFYSHQWRTWAACFIQTAWRRHVRRQLEESLLAQERKAVLAALTEGGAAAPNLGASLYLSRFAQNLKRVARRSRVVCSGESHERLPVMVLQKPAEPDFGAEKL